MEIQDGRGQHRKQIELINLKLIEDFFKTNPKATRTECSEITGLSLVTIRKHIKTIFGI